MVSYDSYKNRIIKIAAVKNFIVKFRILFIALISLILATVTALLVMKGMVVGGLTLPAEIYYGDTFEAEGANVLLGSYRLEYASADRETVGKSAAKCVVAADKNSLEWTDKKPDRAGSYYVRTVTRRSFGITGYGSPVAFEIKPKDVEFVISSESVIYGENPDEYIFPLVGNDRLVATGLKFDFESFEADLTDVCANAQSVRVIDEYGEDVTYCYNIITPKTEVKLVERKITASPKSAEFTFDGSPVDFESAVSAETEKALGTGDRAVITTAFRDSSGNALEGAPVLAGTYTAEITSINIFNGDTDVTARYGITLKPCTVRINKRALTVTTASAEREYDGTPLSDTTFKAEGFAEGSGHYAKAEAGAVSITYAGSVKNVYTFGIFGEDGTDYTQSYDITYVYGTLSVLRKQVTLKTGSAEKIYDGTPLSAHEDYTLSALADGDTQSLSSFTERTVKGQSENAITLVISDRDGNDVTENYQFTNDFGTLEIKPLAITVTTGSAQKVYDGTPIYGSEALPEFTTLIAGHTYEVSQEFSITDVSEADNVTLYVIFSDGEDVTSNYDITYVYGTLTVNVREVTVTTSDIEWVYDGTQHRNEAEITFTYNEGNDGLVAGHLYNITQYTYVLGVCEGVENACLVEIYDPAGNDISGNYRITSYVYGSLAVTPRDTVIVTGSASREYDGTPFVYTDGALGDNLAAGHSLAVDTSKSGSFSSVTDVAEGYVENTVFYNITDVDGQIATENYNVTYVAGYISVTPREIIFTTPTAEWEYDGEVHFNKEYTLTREDGEPALVLSHKLDIVAWTSMTDAGNADNVSEFVLYDENALGTDIDGNYHITYSYGTVTVTRRQITVTTLSDEWEYDGEVHFNSEVTVSREDGEPALVLNHELGIAGYSSITDAGTLENNVYCYIFVSLAPDGYVNYTDNYAIHYENGALTVTPREIIITTATATWEYNGEVRFDESVTVSREDGEAALVADAQITVLSHTGISDVGEAENVLECVVSDNYHISYVYGALSVTPREIILETNSEEWVYDAVAHFNNEVYIYREDGEPALVLDHSFMYVPKDAQYPDLYYNIIKSVGEVENSIEINVIGADYESVAKNYNITYKYGTLKVNKREIVITTGTVEWEYNGTAYRRLEANARYGDLVLGHVIEITSWTEITDVGVVDNVLKCKIEKEFSINIPAYDPYDPYERSVNDNYSITYVYGTITVYPREITITTASGSKVYDGTPYRKYKYKSVERLLSNSPINHALILDSDRQDEFASVTFVTEGEKDNVLYFKVIDGMHRDFSYNYHINYIWGKIKIDPRPVTITTGTDSKEYDGTALWGHSATAVPTFENIVSGEYLDEGEILEEGDIIYGGDIANVDDVYSVIDVNYTDGEVAGVDNQTTYRIYQEVDGKPDFNSDRTENYVITYIFGLLTVTPREIKITTATATWEYDGQDRFDERFEVTRADGEFTLVDGHELRVVEHTAVRDVGEYENKLICKVFVGNDDFVNGNYRITYVFGILSITKHKLTIYTGSATKVYDGEELRGDDSNLIEGRRFEGLFENFLQESVTFASITDVKREGDEVVGIENDTVYRILDPDNADVTDNFEISYVNGTLTVTPRKLTIHTRSATKVYDGTALYGDEAKLASETTLRAPEFENIAKTDRAVVYETDSAVNVLYDGEQVIGKPNNTTYRIYRLNTSTSDNYEIEYDFGTLTVTPRPLNITTGTQSKTYDGTPLSADKVAPTPDNLANGESLSPVAETVISFTDVQYADGEVTAVDNTTKYKVYKGSEETTLNYVITYSFGKLTVTPRDITVHTAGGGKVYDGSAYTNYNYEKVENLLDTAPFNHVIRLDDERKDEFGSVTFVTDGEKDNTLYYKVFDGEKDISYNYNIGYECGKIKIDPRPVKITTGTDTKVYDGTPLSGHSDTAVPKFENIVSGESPKLSGTAFSVTYVRYADGKVIGAENTTEYSIYAGDDDRTDNYEIEYVKGTLTVTPRPLNITTGTDKKVYDGTPLSGHSDTAVPVYDNLAAGEELRADYIEKLTDVKYEDNQVVSVHNATTYKIYSGETETTANYSVTYENGTLTVTKRPLKITTATAEHEYDNTPFAPDYADKADGLVGGHNLIGATGVTVTNVGEQQNNWSFNVIIGDDESALVTDNYEITYEYGTIKVTPRRIELTTPTPDAWEYDGQAHSADSPVVLKHIASGGVQPALVSAHKIVVVSGTEITDAGSCDNVLVCIVQDETTDKNYDISYVYGTLTVNPRKINVTTDSASKEYDGTPLSAERAQADRLVGGHTLEVINEWKSVLHVSDGEVVNDNQYKITAGDKDVTANYAITPVNGKIRIRAKGVKVVLNGMPDLTYGDAFTPYATHENNFASITPATVGNDKLTVGVYISLAADGSTRFNGTPKDVDTYYLFIDAENCTVTGDGEITDYSVSQEDACAFDIIKRRLSVTLKDFAGKEYDGEQWLFPDTNFEPVDTAYGETFRVGVTYTSSSGTIIAVPTDADTYTVRLAADKCLIDGSSVGLKNYLITADNFVTFEITPRQLTVTLSDVTRVYDGKNFDYFGEGNKITVNRLLDGVTFSATVTALDSREQPAKYADTYSINLVGWDVSGDKKSNYATGDVAPKLLTVNKREIDVLVWFNGSDELKVEYRGTVIPDSEMGYDSRLTGSAGYGFVAGDDGSVTPKYTFMSDGVAAQPLERGTYDVSVSFAGNALIDNNYDIHYFGGTLKITNRQVTVRINDIADTEYNGKSYTGEFGYSTYHTPESVNSEGFLDGDESRYEAVYTVTRESNNTVYNRDEIIYAGTYKVTVQLVLKAGYPQGYEITYEDGKSFTVEKRSISVRVIIPDGAQSLVYTKKLPDISGYTFAEERAVGYSGEAFVNDDKSKITEALYRFTVAGNEVDPINVEKYDVSVYGFESQDNFISDNYLIRDNPALFGKLEITQRTLVVTAQSQSTKYAGKSFSLSSDGFEILYGELMEGDVFTVTKGSATLAATQPSVQVQIGSYDITSDGQSVKGNYKVITSYSAAVESEYGFTRSDFMAQLSFKKRTVTVRQILPEQYKTFVYTGSLISVPNRGTLFEIVDDGTSELLAGESLFVMNTMVGVSAGTYSKWLTVSAKNSNGVQIVWAYDINVITSEESAVTITPVNITVEITGDISGYSVNDVISQSDYKITSGKPVTGDTVVLTLTENGVVADVVQKLTSDQQVSKSGNYSVLVLNQANQ